MHHEFKELQISNRDRSTFFTLLGITQIGKQRCQTVQATVNGRIWANT